jgi:hypothetical protein
VRAIGFEAGEERRTYAHVVKAIGLDAGEEHRLTWTQSAQSKGKRLSREQWLDIAQAGLPVPIKSACFFCPASKKREIAWLQEHHPELLERALQIERNAQAKLKSVKGLGRSFSWDRYVNTRINLPLLEDLLPERITPCG